METEYVDFGFDTDKPSLSDKSIRQSFIETFQEVFEKRPYAEQFVRTEVEDILLDYRYEHCSVGRLLLERDSHEVIGFAFGYKLAEENLDSEEWRRKRLRQESDTGRRVEEFFDGQTFYGDEFGIHPDHQGEGLGSKLYDQVVSDVVDELDTDRVMLMTMEGNPAVRFYEDRGFDPTGIVVPVYQQRIDGEVHPDERILMEMTLQDA